MNDVSFPQLNWFKSSKSSPDGRCAMCARLPDGGMAVKTSKHPDEYSPRCHDRARRLR